MTYLSQTTVCNHTPRSRMSLVARILSAIALRRQRNAIRDMPSHMLDDIGVTRAEALTEARKSAWDVPQNWRR